MSEIVQIREDLVRGHYEACTAVAAERRYLASVTLPPFNSDDPFPRPYIENGWPMYVAIEDNHVVGWADLTPAGVAEHAHRATLGMGVIASHRGKGLGRKLLNACLAHAPRSGISKVELTVFTNNTAAVELYRSAGFADVGVLHDYRRLDGEVYDALLMERFLR
jgi:ribosomal protein S18 acetylase RimI-like enzyme